MLNEIKTPLITVVVAVAVVISAGASSQLPDNSKMVTNRLTVNNCPPAKHTWKNRSGSWNFEHKIISGTGGEEFNKCYYTKKFKDIIYEVKMAKTNGTDPIGILFRYNDNTDAGYGILVWPDGNYEFSKIIRNTRNELESGKPSSLNKGLNNWNSIKVICKKTQFFIYINGQQVSSLIDPYYKEGAIGLCIYGDTNQTAEFLIIHPDLK